MPHVLPHLYFHTVYKTFNKQEIDLLLSLGGNRYSLKNDSRRKDLNLHTELAFLILTFKEQIILRLDCLSLVMP